MPNDQLTTFFEELLQESIPYGLADELRNIPKNEWQETTKDWFNNNIYIGSYESLPDDNFSTELLEYLIQQVQWNIVVKQVTKTKIKKALKEG